MARRRKTLSPEDEKLWALVKQSATPLHTAKITAAILGPNSVPAVKTPAKTPAKIMSSRMVFAPTGIKKPISRPQEPLLRFDLAVDPMQPLSRVPKKLDKRTHERLRKGKTAPEARIDLHGMTAAQAHGALRGFIHASHGRGLRLVLVITGKGNTMRDEIGIMPTRNGVLRHALPQWLDAPDMHPMILQISAAHMRHGGGGAYYVYLKKKGRS